MFTDTLVASKQNVEEILDTKPMLPHENPINLVDGDNTVGVITNRIPREIIGGHELTKEELKEFDWMSIDDIDDGSFFRYKGWVYYLGDFMPVYNNDYWDGIQGESYFSGILVKIVEDGDGIIVGRYCS